jgi:hypothetical protein
MMSSIDVFIYSYKGKLLKDVVRSIINNSSGQNIVSISIIDQHPLDRSKQFFEEFKINYKHIFWDFQKSPVYYKRKGLIHSKSEYFMSISDNVLLSKDWDIKLLDFVKDKNVIVSGAGKLSVGYKNKFYLESIVAEDTNFSLNNFIDRSFIFASSSIFKKIDYPVYIKYNGEEELLTIDFYTQGFDIYGAPSDFCSIVGPRSIETVYVPFSLNHNYNAALQALQTGFNKFKDYNNKSRSLAQLEQFLDVKFKKLSLLPFSTNDVDYNPENLDFNAVDARRFVARTKSIH